MAAFPCGAAVLVAYFDACLGGSGPSCPPRLYERLLPYDRAFLHVAGNCKLLTRTRYLRRRNPVFRCTASRS